MPEKFNADTGQLTQRYLAAVDSFIEKAKKDVNIIAVIIAGSLANDVVWEKSDIDATAVVRDQNLKVPEFCLDEDGIILNMRVVERSKFVRELESGAWSASFMAKARVMYTTDESITKMVEQNKIIGEREAQSSAASAACQVVYYIEKCQKWLYVKKDYTYCRYYIIKMAEALAALEIWLSKEAPGREVLQRAQALNPALVERFYYYPMSRELTEGELEELIDEAEKYLLRHIDYISEPFINFLSDGEVKTLTEFYRQFRWGGHDLVHLLEFLASKGKIERLSETIKLTPKSRPNFEEIAFVSPEHVKF
ncbi:MAG: nucleotidyltransferase [Oscillospiraceae bacterium]|nr:nucleotidyltransferase [Oscillospiraceae bacterium]